MKSILFKAGGFITLLFFTVQSIGQDDKKIDVDINVNKSDSSWYQQPWVWIVGAAVFILILVAILKSGGRKRD